MSVIQNNLLLTGGDEGYNLTRSLRFRSSASAYLNRTPASAGNRKTWTWSGWVKRGLLSGGGQTMFGTINGASDTTLMSVGFYDGTIMVSTGTRVLKESANQLRDPGAWYHIVAVLDTTQASNTDRVKLYVNGVQVTSFATEATITQNTDFGINQSATHYTSTYDGTNNKFDGYLSEVNFIDGQALTPSSFGSTNAQTGVWQPAKYTGTYGTNGFYLPFTDVATTSGSNAGLGKDFSGNGNYWNTNNISVTAGVTYDSMTDVPTLTSATASNFCTLNPLTVTTGTVSNGNLQYVGASSSKRINGTLSVNSGKWYWEVTLLNAPESPRSSSTAYNGFGFGLATAFDSTTGGTSSTDWLNLKDNGFFKNFSNTNTDTGIAFASGDVLAVAVDLDANTFTFYRNNTSVATGTIGVTAGTILVPAMYSFNGSFGAMACNFGQRPFAYTPPTGFVALNTFNLPTPTIGATASSQANKYMDATLYTGNGSTQTITNAASFAPALVWVKQRNGTGWNILTDLVRGANKQLYSNATNAEGTDTQLITALNSNGFSVAYNGGSDVNANGSSYVGWQWAGNGTGVTNTAGSITSTVSANTTSGFSVVTYTLNNSTFTVGHGLGVAPKMILVKNRDAGNNWDVYHASLGAGVRLKLNSTDGSNSSTQVWNNTAPTSTVFSGDSAWWTNPSTSRLVAYCFAEVAGFSKFGSYTGNGSSDGTFVYTGFRPKYVLVKLSSGVENWYVLDSVRNTFNVVNNFLEPNTSLAENEGGSPVTFYDFVSNGFKIRNNGSFVNTSGATYIYMAFASNPFKYSLGA